MSHSGCPSSQQLIDFCIGKLSELEIDAVTGHLDSCTLCQETVKALEKIPIPFVEYYLAKSDTKVPGIGTEPQVRNLISKLKDLCPDSTNPSA